MTTSRTFFNVVTPVVEAWIQEESPMFYDRVIAVNLARSRSAKLFIEGIRLNTSCTLLGKFGDKKHKLDAQLNCSIQYDASTCVLQAWCTPDSLEHVKEVLTAAILTVKQLCLTEVKNATRCGNTRVIFGAGGFVDGVTIRKPIRYSEY